MHKFGGFLFAVTQNSSIEFCMIENRESISLSTKQYGELLETNPT